LIRLTLVVSSLFSALALTTAHAAEPNTIARPAAARDTAARDADYSAVESEIEDDAMILVPAALDEEPLRDLIDKYAPSAVEWSLLPRVAVHLDASSQLRNVAAASAMRFT